MRKYKILELIYTIWNKYRVWANNVAWTLYFQSWWSISPKKEDWRLYFLLKNSWLKIKSEYYDDVTWKLWKEAEDNFKQFLIDEYNLKNEIYKEE